VKAGPQQAEYHNAGSQQKKPANLAAAFCLLAKGQFNRDLVNCG
jgi:hypothetical protein